jgi:hypothetical protein
METRRPTWFARHSGGIVRPRSVLKYAAQAGGYFPGDYIGAAIAPGRLYLVWAVSSTPPPYSASKYHQIIYGATLRP